MGLSILYLEGNSMTDAELKIPDENGLSNTKYTCPKCGEYLFWHVRAEVFLCLECVNQYSYDNIATS